MGTRLLLAGANSRRGQAEARQFRKPALRRRLGRFACLIVIALASIGVWVAAIWTAFAILGLGA